MSAILVGLLALAAPAAGAAKTKIALLPIEHTGVEARLLPSLAAVLAVELEMTGAFEVTAASDLEATLEVERQRDALGCVEAGCLVDIGAMLGVDRILRTHIGKVGEAYILDLSLIHARTARSEGRAYETIRGEPEKLLEGARRAVAKLPRPSSELDAALSPAAAIEQAAPAWDNTPAWVVAGVGVATMVAGGILRSRLEAQAPGTIVLGAGAATLLGGLFMLGGMGPEETPEPGERAARQSGGPR